MQKQTWYHEEEKTGILSCHCPGCSSCHVALCGCHSLLSFDFSSL